MDIVNFDNIKVGDELLVISNYGRKQETKIVEEKGSYSISFTDGSKYSTWDRDKSEIAIEANHPSVIEAKKDFHLQSIVKALSFGSSDILDDPEVKALVLKIYDIAGDKIDKRIRQLQSMSALGKEAAEINEVAQKLYSQESK